MSNDYWREEWIGWLVFILIMAVVIALGLMTGCTLPPQMRDCGPVDVVVGYDPRYGPDIAVSRTVWESSTFRAGVAVTYGQTQMDDGGREW